jgi:polar amino acid transport system substrate-binding protein
MKTRQIAATLLAAAVLAGAAVGTAAGVTGAAHGTQVTTGTHAVQGADTCNPKASSLRPDGPPQVTAGSFAATIKARGYLIAGVDQSTYHFGFLNPLDGRTEGFDIDMIDAIATAIFGHADSSTVHFKAISDSQRIPAVTSGQVDIVAHTMTITCDRLTQVAFSSVYFDAGQRVLVQSDSAARSLADLKGQKVCATSGSDSLKQIAAAGAVPVSVAYWTDCLVLLQQGDVTGISTDDSILAGLVAQDPFTRLIGPRLTDEPYGLAISHQHPDFVRFVNGVLQQLRTDGRWAASYAHWVGTPVPPPPPAQYGG